MRYSISDTAEYGDLTRGPTRHRRPRSAQTMKQILADIKSGAFAEEWIAENRSGRKHFEALRAAGRRPPHREGRGRAARHDAVHLGRQEARPGRLGRLSGGLGRPPAGRGPERGTGAGRGARVQPRRGPGRADPVADWWRCATATSRRPSTTPSSGSACASSATGSIGFAATVELNADAAAAPGRRRRGRRRPRRRRRSARRSSWPTSPPTATVSGPRPTRSTRRPCRWPTRSALLEDWSGRLLDSRRRRPRRRRACWRWSRTSTTPIWRARSTTQRRVRVHPIVEAVAVDAEGGGLRVDADRSPRRSGGGGSTLSAEGWDWDAELERASRPAGREGGGAVGRGRDLRPGHRPHQPVAHHPRVDRPRHRARPGPRLRGRLRRHLVRHLRPARHAPLRLAGHARDRGPHHARTASPRSASTTKGSRPRASTSSATASSSATSSTGAWRRRTASGRSNGCAFADSPLHVPIQRMANVSLQPAPGPGPGPSTEELVLGGGARASTSWATRAGPSTCSATTSSSPASASTASSTADSRASSETSPTRRQTTEFWGSLEAVGGGSTYVLGGAFNCGKGQPGQVAPVSHGCPVRVVPRDPRPQRPGGVVPVSAAPGAGVERRRSGRHLPSPQEVVERALAASRAEGCVVIVEEVSQAEVRFANNTTTTNGVRRDRRVAVVSFRAAGADGVGGLRPDGRRRGERERRRRGDRPRACQRGRGERAPARPTTPRR